MSGRASGNLNHPDTAGPMEIERQPVFLNRYNVLWTRLDGQLMSLWKKRTVSGLIAGLETFPSLWHCTHACLSSVDQDHFSEVLFHVSSITNLKKQDKRRFSIYFKKKRYDFMAHSEGKVKKKGTL